MEEPYEYDAFLSFSSNEADIVRPIWQELSHNGIRVFWSDASLRDELGSTWFDVIEKSLERSKHLVLICSKSALQSDWVRREYRAFFNYCYRPNTRTLIPLLHNDIEVSDLPLFLRDMQIGLLSDPNVITILLEKLGQSSFTQLKKELTAKKREIHELNSLIAGLREELSRRDQEIFKEKEKEIDELHQMVKKLRSDLNKQRNANRSAEDISTIAKLQNEISKLHRTRFEERSEYLDFDDR